MQSFSHPVPNAACRPALGERSTEVARCRPPCSATVWPQDRRYTLPTAHPSKISPHLRKSLRDKQTPAGASRRSVPTPRGAAHLKRRSAYRPGWAAERSSLKGQPSAERARHCPCGRGEAFHEGPTHRSSRSESIDTGSICRLASSYRNIQPANCSGPEGSDEDDFRLRKPPTK